MARTLKIYIMCGGSGTRLWPLSRSDNPKQMLHLTGRSSMLSDTIERASFLDADIERSINVIGSESQRSELTTLNGVDQVILEPIGRNTAAAVAVAALHAADDEDPCVLILPADHAIDTVEQFSASLSMAFPAAESGSIVTFGIEPDRPATGYGYIEVETAGEISSTKRFVEKPDEQTAQEYLSSGRYLWNAGMFLARASVFRAALEEHASDIAEAAAAAFADAVLNSDVLEFDPASYGAIPAESIDYAVMEKASNLKAVRAKFSWSDIGSFQALKDAIAASDEENVSKGDVVALESKGNLLRSEGPLVAAFGVDNLAIVATPDATFVSPLAQSEDVKRIVAELEKKERRELHQTPWKAECGVVPGAMSERLQDWLFEIALPFWMKHGLDREHGGFHEVLRFDGQSAGADKRLRTMARQTYVFAKALDMGWDETAGDAVRHGLSFLEQAGSASGGGWFKTFTASGCPFDKTQDVYDHAFVLLAAAQATKVGIEEAQAVADRVIGFIDSMSVSSPAGSFNGYLEDDRASLPRRANPHMHLLEAFLAWYEATGDRSALDRASQIVSLFCDHFCCRDGIFLREEFDATLESDEKTSRHIEPGHHFEWAWLLHWYARASRKPLLPQMRNLIASAKAFGINPVSQLVHDRVEADGSPSHETSRCWPQTELMKAELALTRHGMPHAAYAAERSAQRLWRHFIEPAPAGLWNDVCDVAGKPVAKAVPASTFYHLICAVDVYLRCHAES